MNYVIAHVRSLQHNVQNEIENKKQVYYFYVLDTKIVIHPWFMNNNILLLNTLIFNGSFFFIYAGLPGSNPEHGEHGRNGIDGIPGR